MPSIAIENLGPGKSVSSGRGRGGKSLQRRERARAENHGAGKSEDQSGFELMHDEHLIGIFGRFHDCVSADQANMRADTEETAESR